MITLARIGTGAAITTTGSITIRAVHRHAVTGQSDGDASDGEEGIGISFALNQIEDDINATLARSVTTSAGGVIVETVSNVSSNMEATASSRGAQGGSNPDQEANAQRNPNNPGATSNTGTATSTTVPSGGTEATQASSAANTQTAVARKVSAWLRQWRSV